MSKEYFGFALASSMFFGDCQIQRKHLSSDEVSPAFVARCEAAINCCNASHTETVKAAYERFGMSLQIPAKPPTVSLESGDSIIVMSVRGLPRLTDDRHYTETEIQSASFEFVVYTVL